MTASVTTQITRIAAAAALAFTLCVPAHASETPADLSVQKPPVQNVSYNGYSCDMVRAKVAETGVVAAYAYALSMGLSRREIARVRKACSV